MIEKIIQAPYIDLYFALATPALIITIIYLFVLSVLLIYEKKSNTMSIGFVPFSKLTQRNKLQIVILVLGYLLLIFSCITLPYFLNEESVLLIISKKFLQYEPIMFLCVLLLFCTVFFNKANKDTHINAYNRILICLIWGSIGSGLLSGQIDYTFGQNIFVLIGAGIISLLFTIIDIKSLTPNIQNHNQFDLISYNPAEKIEELFPLHKEQAEDIANIISSSSSNPFSVCLSGKWGTGKTSVINGVKTILSNTNDKLFEFIYINALELDDKTTLVNYLMTQIKEKLKSHGAYVGIDSEYKEFLSATAGSLTSDSVNNLIFKKLSIGDDDYRFQKKRLETVLQRTFKSGKLVVIVDDIERCNSDTAREFLFLIKEVATMKNCVSIFVTDYDMLNQVVCVEDNTAEPSDFLNKFFNYKINLNEEQPESILSYYDKFFNDNDPSFMSIYRMICKSPGTWYNDIISSMSLKIDKLKQQSEKYLLSQDDANSIKEKLNQQKEIKALFEGHFKNSRNVAKFYNVFRNNIIYCESHLVSGNINMDEITKYVDSRNIGQVIFLLSFTEVFMFYEYQQFIKSGAKYVEPLWYGENTNISKERRLLIELANITMWGNDSDFQEPNAYIKEDIRTFIDAFLKKERDLYKLVKYYTSDEEEWVTALEQSNESIIKDHWDEIILMVLHVVPNEKSKKNNKWRNQMFSTLLEYAEKQIENEKWSIDKIFSIFDHESHTERLFATGTGLLQTFYNHMRKSKIYTKPSNEVVERVYFFSHNYTYTRIGTMYRLAHYLLPNNYIEQETKDLQEYLLNSNNNFYDNILEFLKNFEKIIPDLSFDSNNWYENFKKFANLIKEYLEKEGVEKYFDVKCEIEHMMDSSEEFLSLQRILENIKSNNCDSDDILSYEINLNDINKIIEDFSKKFNNYSSNKNNQQHIDRQFADFFKQLQIAQNITISEEQVNCLHELVSTFVNLTGYSSLPYRRILINISQKQKSDIRSLQSNV